MGSTLSAIAEPSRQRILQLVWNRERSAGEIAAVFDVTFGAVSQHLRVLREAGVVEVRAAGARRWYLANRKALGPLAAALEQMWDEKLATLKRHAEEEEGGGAKEMMRTKGNHIAKSRTRSLPSPPVRGRRRGRAN